LGLGWFWTSAVLLAGTSVALAGRPAEANREIRRDRARRAPRVFAR
jgi:hypothetical protein